MNEKILQNIYSVDIFRIPIIAVISIVFIGLGGDLRIDNSHASSERVKNVLILHSYHPESLWTEKIMIGISSIFTNENVPVELYVEYMDTKRHVPEKIFPVLRQLYKQKYQDVDLDVIILSDNNALNFVLANRDDLFRNVPVVFCGINNFKFEMLGEHKNIIGVVEDISIERTIQLLLDLHPDVKEIVVINDQTETGIQNKSKFQQAAKRFSGAIEFVELDDVSISMLHEKLSNLPDSSVLLLFTFHRDRDGKSFTIEEYFAEITSHSNLPIYSFWEHYLGLGIVGGVLTNGKAHGVHAADMAVKILRGKSTGEIPILTTSPNLPMFDFEQMRTHGIEKKSLPKKSTVINKPLSFYERYKLIVWSVLLVFVVLISLVVALSVNVIRRRQIEKEILKHRDHLEELVAERTVELADANQALVDSEERYRNLSDTAFEAIVISERGVILEANEAMSEMFGYSLSELVGMTATELTVPEERENVSTKIRTGYEQSYETYCLKKDGSGFPAEIRARMFTYRGRKVRGTTIRDISERKIAEEEFQLAHTRLRTILDAVNIMIYVADLDSYEILLVNKYVKTHFGDIEGKKCWESIQNQQNGPCPFCRYHQLQKQDQVLSSLIWEVQNRRNGEWYECHDEALQWVDGRTVRIQAAINITERKKNEQERERLITELENAISEIKMLQGILPICSFCKKIRNDDGNYEQVETYIHKHSGIGFSHTVCPACMKKHYSQFSGDKKK